MIASLILRHFVSETEKHFLNCIFVLICIASNFQNSFSKLLRSSRKEDSLPTFSYGDIWPRTYQSIWFTSRFHCKRVLETNKETLFLLYTQAQLTKEFLFKFLKY